MRPGATARQAPRGKTHGSARLTGEKPIRHTWVTKLAKRQTHREMGTSCVAKRLSFLAMQDPPKHIGESAMCEGGQSHGSHEIAGLPTTTRPCLRRSAAGRHEIAGPPNQMVRCFCLSRGQGASNEP